LGIAILPPCVNCSAADYTVEGQAIRCGLRFIRDLSETAVQRILAERGRGPFTSLRDFCARAPIAYPLIENLIEAQAFAFTGQSRGQLLGMLAVLPEQQEREPTLDWNSDQRLEAAMRIDPGPPLTPLQRLQLDLHLLGLSTGVSPFAPWRERAEYYGVVPCDRLLEYPHGATVRVAGIVVARARPPVRSGRTTIFICLEDHTGLVDVTIFSDTYEKYGSVLYSSSVLMVEGELTRRGERDVAVTVKKVAALPAPRALQSDSSEPVATLTPRDFANACAKTGPGSHGG
jgi:error-prone DNA polymerase